MARTIIIGAGLTGLSAAYHLEQKGYTNLLILEQESNIGGLCRSVSDGGFTFDYTGHFLHLNNPYVSQLVASIIGFDFFNEIARRSFIFSNNTFTPYPFQMHLHGLPIDTCVDCIEGFITRPCTKRKPHSFHDWVMHNFGAGFGKHFFFPYQQKIFDYDVRKLQASWTGRFVPSTSLRSIIAGTITPHTQDAVGYNATFFYPKTPGIATFIEAFARHVQSPIITNTKVTHIDLTKKVITCADGSTHEYEQIISTMPLDLLIASINDTPTTLFCAARGKLQCTSVININLGLREPLPTNKHWVYYPEATSPWYRLGYPHAICPAAAPAQSSSVSLEISHRKRSHSWQTEAINRAHLSLNPLLGIEKETIATEMILRLPHAYVVFDSWREKHLQPLLFRLAHENIHSIGRYGAWKYASMHEAILDGKQIADMLTFTPVQRADSILIPPRKQPRENLQQL